MGLAAGAELSWGNSWLGLAWVTQTRDGSGAAGDCNPAVEAEGESCAQPPTDVPRPCPLSPPSLSPAGVTAARWRWVAISS